MHVHEATGVSWRAELISIRRAQFMMTLLWPGVVTAKQKREGVQEEEMVQGQGVGWHGRTHERVGSEEWFGFVSFTAAMRGVITGHQFCRNHLGFRSESERECVYSVLCTYVFIPFPAFFTGMKVAG